MDEPAEKITKKRRIHMNVANCVAFEQTEEGSQALRDPFSVNISSHHLSYLQPKPSRNKTGVVSDATVSGFVKASSLQTSQNNLLVAKLNVEAFVSDDSKYPNAIVTKGKKKSKFPSQSNNMLNYFPVTSTSPIKCTSYSPLSKIPGSQTLYTQGVSTSPSTANSSARPNNVINEKINANITTVKRQLIVNTTRKNKSKRVLKHQENSNIAYKDLSEEIDDDFDVDNTKMLKKRKTHPFNSAPRKSSMLSFTEKFNSEKLSDEMFNNSFGLLGSIDNINTVNDVLNENSNDDVMCFFQLLPVDIMQNIFCHLPLWDLCLNMTRVCRYWNEIISDSEVTFIIFVYKAH